MRVYPLTDDYTGVDVAASYPLFVGGHREAPAVVKIDGTYHVLTSGQSGWYPNQTRTASTTDLSNPNGWSELSLVGNNTSFYSQPTNIITVQGIGGERSYIYMGDRWNSKKLGASTYVWLPLTIADGAPSLTYQPGWSFNPVTAAITAPRVELVSQGKSASATSENAAAPASRANDGVITNTALSGDSTNYFQPTTIPASWTVDLEEETDLARIDLGWRSWNGSESRSTYSVYGSNDNETWTKIADRESNRLVGFTTDDLAGTYRYVKVTITSVINDHNGNAAVWAAGIVEAQVYAKLPPEPVVLSSIAVSSAPSKVNYLQGEALDLAGLVVTATYSDQTTAVIDNAALAVSGYDPQLLGTQTVTLEYTEPEATPELTRAIAAAATGSATTSFDVEVTAVPVVTVSSIAVTTPPTKVSYLSGDALDLNGLVVTATNSDQTTTVLDASAYRVTGYNPDVTGSQTLTVALVANGEITSTFAVTVTARSTDPTGSTGPAETSTGPSGLASSNDSASSTASAASTSTNATATATATKSGGELSDTGAIIGIPLILALLVLMASGAGLLLWSRGQDARS